MIGPALFQALTACKLDPLPGTPQVKPLKDPSLVSLLACVDKDVVRATMGPSTYTENDLNKLRSRHTVLVYDSCIMNFTNNKGASCTPVEALGRIHTYKKVFNPWTNIVELGGGGATPGTMALALKTYRDAHPELMVTIAGQMRFNSKIECPVFVAFNGFYDSMNKLCGCSIRSARDLLITEVEDLCIELTFYLSPTVTCGPSAAHSGLSGQMGTAFGSVVQHMMDACLRCNVYASLYTNWWKEINCFRATLYDWHCHDKGSFELAWHLDRMFIRLKCYGFSGWLDPLLVNHLNILFDISTVEVADTPSVKLNVTNTEAPVPTAVVGKSKPQNPASASSTATGSQGAPHTPPSASSTAAGPKGAGKSSGSTVPKSPLMKVEILQDTSQSRTQATIAPPIQAKAFIWRDVTPDPDEMGAMMDKVREDLAAKVNRDAAEVSAEAYAKVAAAVATAEADAAREVAEASAKLAADTKDIEMRVANVMGDPEPEQQPMEVDSDPLDTSVNVDFPILCNFSTRRRGV